MANPNIAKLKKKATDFEQKKQFDRALSLYIQLLEEAGRDLDDADLQLYNRVGDLLQRQGNVSEALAYYEKAVDVYAERGFLNNAIALCNKVLRQSPARTSVYYKLGKISATKGFKSDAKKNFLEYAERMQKSGHVDEAFRALKEFADLCPDQDDIRLMLADWLQKENRKSEAVEQLETLFLKLEVEGREAEARATIDRIKAIDPTVVPRASGSFQAVKSNDLVFLDLDDAEPPPPRHAAPAPPEAPVAPPVSPRVPALDGLILTFHPDDEEQAPTAPSRAIDGFESTAAPDEPATEPLVSLVADFEPLAAPSPPEEQAMPSLLTMEAASWTESVDAVPHVEGLEGPRTSLVGAHPAMAPLIDAPPMTGEEFGELALARNDDASHTATSGRTGHDLALPSSLPVLPADGSIDLLRVMGTPLGSPAIADPDEARAAAEIDLLSLPPVGDSLGHSASLEWPVTGSETPLHPSTDEQPDHVGAPEPRSRTRDTSELVAQDGSARTTDELLVVPSEEIDEETRRSLRLEFALDGDETPDAWVEAAMRATDDRSLDQLLTPLYSPTIAEVDTASRAASDASIDASADSTLPSTYDVAATPPAWGDDPSPWSAEARAPEPWPGDAERVASETSGDDAVASDAPGGDAPVDDAPVDDAVRAATSVDSLAPVASAATSFEDRDEVAGVDANGAVAEAQRATHDASAAGEGDTAGLERADANANPHAPEDGASESESLEAAFARLASAREPMDAPTEASEPPMSDVHVSTLDVNAEAATTESVAEGVEFEGEASAEDPAADASIAAMVAGASGEGDWDAGASGLEAPGSLDDARDSVTGATEDGAADGWHAPSIDAGELSERAVALGDEAAIDKLGADDARDALETAAVSGEGWVEAVGAAGAEAGVEPGVGAAAAEGVAEGAGVEAGAEGPPAVSRPLAESLELLAIPEPPGEQAPSRHGPVSRDAALGEGVPSDVAPGDAANARPEFDLLDELLPPFMRHDGAATRAADVAEREALAEAGAGREGEARALDASDVGSALDVDALRALMLDRESDEQGALTRAGAFDDPALASAFREKDVELPLLDIEDLVSHGTDDYNAPLDLSDVLSDDILGSPPTFGEGTEPEFAPDPLFPIEGTADEQTAASALPDAEASDEWPQDAAPEVLIDGEWHDEHMGDLVSGEITAIRSDHEQLPPRATPRWDDLAAALLWPPAEDGPPVEGAGPSDDASRLTGHGMGATPPRGSFLERLQTPRSTLSFGGVEAQLRRRLELDPANLVLRRQLGEALLDQGNRDEGLQELDLAMAGFEQAGDLESARGVADIVLRTDSASVRHHQKRVEYAVRSNDRVRLVEAYVELADSLFRSGEPEKARVVYSRVLELSPGNGRARFALGLLSPDEAAAHTGRIATPPELPPLPPTPADMVSLFDRAIPRTPASTLASISAEIPVIADGIFLPRVGEDEPPVRVTDAGPELSVHDVLAAERQSEQAEIAASHAPDSSPSEGQTVSEPTTPGARAHDQSPAGVDPVAPADAGATVLVGADVAVPGRDVDTERGARSETPTSQGVDADRDGATWPNPAATSGAHDVVAAAHGRVTGELAVSSEVPGPLDDEANEARRAARGHDAAVASGELAGEIAGEAADADGDEGDDEADAVFPFPAPTLDDQIEAAFAVPALVELDGPVVREGEGDDVELHDISVTPLAGAAAFATPFSVPAPVSPSVTPIGLTPIGVTPIGTTPPVVRAIAETPVSVRAAEPPVVTAGAGSADDDFVDLGSWLRDDEPVRSTRMVTAEAPPSGDEQADFDEMLRRFKQGVAANVEEEDYASHYDLGVAYKEMGLVDEAIAEFQKSLRGESHRVRSYEALGQCFVEKGQLQVAVTLLRRALETTGADDQQLVGVLYLLGYASEVLARHADAVSYYQRVFAVDIEFRDVAQRVAALEQKTQ